ncbi:MAG: DUF4123 domain-containing protein [Bacteroidetes bacterium]|nr:DUF4123 domain-containing protein [Bacteroidota bacterium]
MSSFNDWYFEKGWGDSWGVLVYADHDLKKLVKHFQKFLTVNTEDGEAYYFRFYDPRVLRVFLPTCDQTQLKDFFGPVNYLICEDEDSAFAFVFSLDNGVLLTEKITRNEVMTFNPAEKKKRSSFRNFWS